MKSTPITAKVIADSLAEATGDRCTTIEVEYPRFVHAELMTHRVFSRNSASSRAVPVTKFLEKADTAPALPEVWASEQPGMQGGSELSGQPLQDALEFWDQMREHSVIEIERYVAMHQDPTQRLHKSLLNRWLEPVLPHKVIVTATDWEGFFHQRSTRYTDLAMPEIAKAADEVLCAIELSHPRPLAEGDLHLPYVFEADWEWAKYNGGRGALIKLAVARCARVSYLTHEGIRDPNKDIELYEKLIGATPMHASPLEHVAYAWAENRHQVALNVYQSGPTVQESGLLTITRDVPKVGNLRGFLQQRAIVEAERGI